MPVPTPTTLKLMLYKQDACEEKQLTQVSEVKQYLDYDGVLWLHMQGLEDEAALREIGEIFNLHPLALEDVVNIPQRPKAEEYDGTDFIVTQTVAASSEHHLQFTQFSMFVERGRVLSFQDGEEDCTEPVRLRIRSARGLIRQRGMDYLMYALLDLIIDSYYPAIEDFGEYLEEVQDEALLQDLPGTLRAIQRTKHEMLALRRVVWPMRDLLTVLMRDDNDNLTPPVKHYLRDCYDHAVQLMDMVETYREMAADLMDAYMSAISNRMNSVMKVLTVIATVFMPLTFIVGVYGMNFHSEKADPTAVKLPFNMPELNWYWGYPMVWAVMILVVIGMVFYFRKLGWIGSSDLPQADREECPLPGPLTQPRGERKQFEE